MRFSLLWLCLSLGCRSSSPPDVIFITIDTLRVDHVAAFHSGSPAETPYMDRLGRMGIRLGQAYSPISVTGPAFVTLQTGQDPDRHGVRRNAFRGGGQMDSGTETLAQRLRSADYRTGAFVSGFTLRAGIGLEQGFQEYSAPATGETRASNRRDGAETVRLAIEWLEANDDPAFLWFHTYDVHGPLDRWTEVPSEGDWDRNPHHLVHLPKYQHVGDITDPEFFRQRYALAVEYVDLQVGQILDSLESAGRLENALVVLTADHGESFTERELWFDHGTHATEEQLHIPLIIHLPGGKRGGAWANELVGLMDIAPTTLDVLGLEPLSGADGISLQSAGAGHGVLMGESSHCKASEEILDCQPHGIGGKELAARSSALTLIHEASDASDELTVYDRVQDPAELSPLTNPGVPTGMVLRLEAMRGKVTATAARLPKKSKKPETAAERREREELESLGYTE